MIATLNLRLSNYCGCVSVNRLIEGSYIYGVAWHPIQYEGYELQIARVPSPHPLSWDDKRMLWRAELVEGHYQGYEVDTPGGFIDDAQGSLYLNLYVPNKRVAVIGVALWCAGGPVVVEE